MAALLCAPCMNVSDPQLPITSDDVAEAARRLSGVANRTPVFTSRDLNERVEAQLFNAVSSLSERELARGVVASSSGNHAQALALAAALGGTSATIFMPQDAPASKPATRLRRGDRVDVMDDREAIVRELVEREGLTPVHPYDDPRIMAGAGTSTLELLEDSGPLDLVVIPAGGGGQLSGGAVAASGAENAPRVIGVEPAAVGQWRASLAEGRPVRVEIGRTIADGQQLRSPGDLPFAVVKALGEDVVGVDDEQMLTAMRYLFERQKLCNRAERIERSRCGHGRADRRQGPARRGDHVWRQHRGGSLRQPHVR